MAEDLAQARLRADRAAPVAGRPPIRQVVRRRRMTRAFDPGRPVAAALLDDLVDLAAAGAERRARPRAGTSSCWRAPRRPASGTSPCRRAAAGFALAGPARRPGASRCRWPTRRPTCDRYAEPDKAATGLGRSADGLAGAVLDGRRRLGGHDAPAGGRGRGASGALFFGVFQGEEELRASAGAARPPGAAGRHRPGLAHGCRSGPPGALSRPPRRAPGEIIHRGGW